jgi:DNA-binding CsgD family transcriptional regulator
MGADAATPVADQLRGRRRLTALTSEDDLASGFGLTPAEIRLVLRLASGLPLREAAKAIGVSYETARTKLKFVFQKTGVRRQAELILLLTRPREQHERDAPSRVRRAPRTYRENGFTARPRQRR